MVEQVERNSKDGCAFLSTPSIFFSLKDKDVKAKSKVFDFDEEFGKKDPASFVKFDFNKVELLPDELRGTFDMVVIDPPYITEEVWAKYAEASRFLLKEGGLILGSTIDENADFLKELLNVRRTVFRPSIPNLVYQYSFYVNYEDEACNVKNPEILDFD